MTGFTTQDGDDLGSNKIARAATASALYNNPIAIAQRDSSAPWLNTASKRERITSGSGSYTVPDDVYLLGVHLNGAGGGGGASYGGGANGGNTTFGSLTALGGQGGQNDTTGRAGGVASGGDVNIDGHTGISTGVFAGLSYGGWWVYGRGGANQTAQTAGGGAYVFKLVYVSPGDVISYSVGAGGVHGSGGGVNGLDGHIWLEY